MSALFGLLLAGVALALPAGTTTIADAADKYPWTCTLVGSDPQVSQSGETSYSDRSSMTTGSDKIVWEIMGIPFKTLQLPETWGLDANLYVFSGFEYFSVDESGKYTGTKGHWRVAEIIDHTYWDSWFYRGVTQYYFQPRFDLRVTFVLDESKCPTVTLDTNAPPDTDNIKVTYDGQEYTESTITLMPGESLKTLTCTHTPYGERVAAARFEGWFLADGTAFDFTQPITADITLVAHWTRRYEIWFDQRGVGGSFYYWATYDEGATVTLPEPHPVSGSDTHYDYYFSVDSSTVPVTSFVCRSGHIVYMRQGEPHRYTVTYNTAGGDPIAAVTVPYKTVLDLPTPTRARYRFDGWLYGGAPYDPASGVSSDITLVASWTLVTPLVTFVVDGEVYTTLEVELGAVLV